MTAPSFRLDQRAAFVTGAASGIGQRLAIALAEVGADVGCFDRPGTDIESTVHAITALGRRAMVLEGDVTEAGALERAIAVLEERLGPLRLAINNAGIASAAPAEDMPLEQWQKVMDVNVTGVFLSCQAEARAIFRHGKGGSLVNIASMSGTIVNRGLLQAHYNASKAAVMHLTKSLAMEWASRGIRVNSISPGYTATPMNRRPEVADQVKQFEADTPLGRMATVDEMAGPAIFLLSDAATFCTGVDLIVDGGFVCW